MIHYKLRRMLSLNSFRNNFYHLYHEAAYFNLALDLAIDIPRPPPTAYERKWEPWEFLDLCREEIVRTPSISEESFTNIINDMLAIHADVYEMRYCIPSLENLNDERKLDLEKNIYTYMNFCKSVYLTKNSFDKWDVYHKISNVMYDADIRKGELWKVLLEMVRINEHSIPRRFYYTCSKQMEYMLKNIKRDIEPRLYRYVQDTVSIHMVAIFGHPHLLQVLLQMGHEDAWDNITKYPFSPLWFSFFGESFASVIHMKPEYISLRRFLLYLHIFKYAEASNSPYGIEYCRFPEKLKLLWRALPDPIITREEMRNAFEEQLRNAFEEEMRNAIEEEMNTNDPLQTSLICENLDKVLSDSPSEPRLLQHLARCTIRKTLNKKSMLPEGIDQLRLPDRLRSYLKLEW